MPSLKYRVPRRPRDDKDGGRLQTTIQIDCYPMFANDPEKSMFILRPPKDLAVFLLSRTKSIANSKPNTRFLGGLGMIKSKINPDLFS